MKQIWRCRLIQRLQTVHRRQVVKMVLCPRQPEVRTLFPLTPAPKQQRHPAQRTRRVKRGGERLIIPHEVAAEDRDAVDVNLVRIPVTAVKRPHSQSQLRRLSVRAIRPRRHWVVRQWRQATSLVNHPPAPLTAKVNLTNPPVGGDAEGRGIVVAGVVMVMVMVKVALRPDRTGRGRFDYSGRTTEMGRR